MRSPDARVDTFCVVEYLAATVHETDRVPGQLSNLAREREVTMEFLAGILAGCTALCTLVFNIVVPSEALAYYCITRARCIVHTSESCDTFIHKCPRFPAAGLPEASRYGEQEWRQCYVRSRIAQQVACMQGRRGMASMRTW